MIDKKMTAEEAAEWLEALKSRIRGGDEDFDKKRLIALDMGIRSLTNIEHIKEEILSYKRQNLYT